MELKLLNFILSHIKIIVNSFGLVLDIIGTCFVASEVVSQFHGEKIIDDGAQCGALPAIESPEYTEWEKNKYKRMKIGLVFLLIGFLLQIISNWL